MVDLFDVFDFSQSTPTPPCCPPPGVVTTPNPMVDTASNLVLASLNQLVNAASDKANPYPGVTNNKQPQVGSSTQSAYFDQQSQQPNQHQQNYGSSGSVIYPLNYQQEQPTMKQKSYQYYIGLNNKKPIYSMATAAGNPLAAAVRNTMSNTGDNTKVIDDEYLSSIRDITKGNQIYSTNNPEMDNLSPSMLWKNASMVTVNKIIPITTNNEPGETTK